MKQCKICRETEQNVQGNSAKFAAMTAKYAGLTVKFAPGTKYWHENILNPHRAKFAAVCSLLRYSCH